MEGRRRGVNAAYHLAVLSVSLSAVLLSLKLPHSWRWFQTGRKGGREGGREGGKEGRNEEKEVEENASCCIHLHCDKLQTVTSS